MAIIKVFPWVLAMVSVLGFQFRGICSAQIQNRLTVLKLIEFAVTGHTVNVQHKHVINRMAANLTAALTKFKIIF